MRSNSRVYCICLTLMAGWLGSVAPLPAQEEWAWPERGQNLQSLPKDFTGQGIRAVMTGFTGALGVRCSHCHVGQEGQPLSTYDFPSDDNPNKQTARQMLAMLGVINDELKKVEPGGAKRVNMWCHTCHAGRPRPMTLSEELTEVYQADGLDAAVARFHELREKYHGRGAYDFSEAALNDLGYGLLGAGQHEAALAFLRINAEQFPESGNAWDSLADAYMHAGQKERAVVFYQKALAIDPTNDNAVNKLRELDE